MTNKESDIVKALLKEFYYIFNNMSSIQDAIHDGHDIDELDDEELIPSYNVRKVNDQEKLLSDAIKSINQADNLNYELLNEIYNNITGESEETKAEYKENLKNEINYETLSILCNQLGISFNYSVKESQVREELENLSIEKLEEIKLYLS